MNKHQNSVWFAKGIHDGIPISLGYFAVAFTLGIAARNAGFTAWQAFLASITNNASAGEYAGFSLVKAGADYIQVAIMTLITNARYLLMSCSLSQKLSPRTSTLERMLIGYDVTDEIFGISVSVPGMLNPFYTYGAIVIALPGWAFGTYFGVVMGNVLPARVVSALSVGLFGMFLAIIIPPARKDRIIAGLVALSMAASFLFAKLPVLRDISSGMRTILLTVGISLAAAILFPHEESENAEGGAGDEK